MATLLVKIVLPGRKEKLVQRINNHADSAELCNVENCPCKRRRTLPAMEVLFAGCSQSQWLTSAELARRAGHGWTPQALGPKLHAAGCEAYSNGAERGWRPPVGLVPLDIETVIARSVPSTPAEGALALEMWKQAREYRAQV